MRWDRCTPHLPNKLNDKRKEVHFVPPKQSACLRVLILVHCPLEKTFSTVNCFRKMFSVVDRRPTSGLWDRPFIRIILSFIHFLLHANNQHNMNSDQPVTSLAASAPNATLILSEYCNHSKSLHLPIAFLQKSIAVTLREFLPFSEFYASHSVYSPLIPHPV